MNLFYLPEVKQGAIQLNPDESRHAIKVLRLKTGDSIQLIDGVGGWYQAKITDPNPKKCGFTVMSETQEPESDFHIHIAIAPTKNIDRLEWFVEKAVEIGIHEISFLLCQNSERKVLKNERLQKKVISAMKQSLKASLPVINTLTKFEDFIEYADQQEKYLAFVDFDNPEQLQKIASRKSSYCVLIGPEGDFTEHELATALEYGYKKVSLGNSRLRTETAGIIACHLLNVINN